MKTHGKEFWKVIIQENIQPQPNEKEWILDFRFLYLLVPYRAEIYEPWCISTLTKEHIYRYNILQFHIFISTSLNFLVQFSLLGKLGKYLIPVNQNEIYHITAPLNVDF